MGHAIGQSSLPAVKYRGFVIIAILAGMAVAAAVVVFQALRTLNAPSRESTASSAPQPKPSAFGTLTTSTSAPDVKMSPAEIAKAGNRAIVTVTGYDDDENPVAQGTGYIYSTNGVVVTTFNAIRGASSVTVDTATGGELNVIAVMGYSASRDLAVLAVLESNLPALESGPAEVVGEGDPVVVLGPANAASKGVVGARRAVGGVDLIPVGVEASAGLPVLNEHGKVIGVTTRRRLDGQMVTLAVPTHYVSDLMAEPHATSFAQMRAETELAP